jgi:thiol-disulfide isomerase/thioredoxin
MPLSFVLLLGLLAPQTGPPPTSNALALLNEVGQRFADAKSYHVEAVEEETLSNDLSHSWQKRLLTAIVQPGGRYRYEGRTSGGDAVAISDGTTTWDYHPDDHAYTQQPASGIRPTSPAVMQMDEYGLMRAKLMVEELMHRGDKLKSATFLPNQTVSIGGKNFECYVVHYSSDDFIKKPGNPDEWTVWIDKARKVVVKTLSRGEHRPTGPGLPYQSEVVVTFPVMELDHPELSSAFVFAPPAEAKMVAEFLDPYAKFRVVPAKSDFVGTRAAELQLKSADGTLVALSSFRGKPVFIDFWATWCLPCVERMPDLRQLYSETASKGLVWLSIDLDEDQAVAEAFAKREHFPWANYHDGDRTLSMAFHRTSVPLGVLIDAEGRITFYQSPYELAELRAAIAALGPQFGSMKLGAAK